MKVVFALLAAAFATLLASTVTYAAEPKMESRPLRVVLIGASIGQEWDLPNLPNRISNSQYQFEALQAWQYDKSELLADVLMRPSRRFTPTLGYLKGMFQSSPQPPDVLLLKECSSYYPGDQLQQREMMRNWVQQAKAKNIRVMLTTVVPVTKARAGRNPGKQAALLAYNDWARDYAREAGVSLLDLETPLRADAKERYLRDDLTSGDGSHLNRKAYDILDGVMLQALCNTVSAQNCPSMVTRAK
jgi:GDSL-like lipase/acylhydrolase family protein